MGRRCRPGESARSDGVAHRAGIEPERELAELRVAGVLAPKRSERAHQRVHVALALAHKRRRERDRVDERAAVAAFVDERCW